MLVGTLRFVYSTSHFGTYTHKHLQQPILMSAGWLGSGRGMQEASIIARHEWKGLQKMNYALHDFDQKQQSERAERAQRRAMPGTFRMESDDD